MPDDTPPDEEESEEESEEELDEDEYETDSDAELDSDGDEDVEQWSLRVRLLSAVDLPPSLSPNVPLCPWFKFGLVEDVNAALDRVAEEKRRAAEEAAQREDEMLERERRRRSDGALGEDDDAAAEQLAAPKRRASADGQAANANTTTRLLSTLPPSHTRTSASKVMSRNANGGGGNGADWNEEYRWNDLATPMEACLAVRLCARLAPDGGGAAGGAGGDCGDANSDHSGYGDGPGEPVSGLRGLWRKGREQLESHRRLTVGGNQREERAAAVAQFLMRGGQGGPGGGDDATAATSVTSMSASQHSGTGAGGALQRSYDYLPSGEDDEDEDEDDGRHAEGLCLGTLTVPLSRLPLEDAFVGDGAAVVERWYQLDDPNPRQKRQQQQSEGGMDSPGMGVTDDEPTLLHGPRRCPSVLLEITFASSDYLDENEEEIPAEVLTGTDKGQFKEKAPATPTPQTPNDKKSKDDKQQSGKKEEPHLESGVVDHVCIVGARDIGNQRSDDGSKGWVQSTPECCVLERFPPDDEFHCNNGRPVGLIPGIECFCFPEGCMLWRGSDAPTLEDLRRGGVSAASSPGGGEGGQGGGGAPSAFDAALGTTSSFSWFVLSSNSDVYGSRLVKTYGILVRFYVPAPKGIDPTQDDFAQTMTGPTGGAKDAGRRGGGNRLWVPVGICITTTLPIVGAVEEVLLRTCRALASSHRGAGGRADGDGSATELSSTFSADSTLSASRVYTQLQTDLFHLIVNHAKPTEGLVHTSIPFLDGERLHITSSPPNGLPPLPHGGAVAATCRLLGAEGLTLLLAATLTECRILVHSTDLARVAMVAEVIAALIFPFVWQLPYIPVLPRQNGMLEILDAPLPFFVGLPTASLQHVEKGVLGEVVVVDLDDVASFTEYDVRRGSRTKIPPALPASVSTSISKAVFRLLKEEDELEAQMKTGAYSFAGIRRPPHLEDETLPERMFRIHVALQICSLIRGYQECLFFVSALQPVFNRDRFLRQAPALFEDKRPSVLIDSNYSDRSQKILSPRSKRFLSVLVNSQHFHSLLERLSSEETAFFHEVMEAIEGEEDAGGKETSATGGSSKTYFTTSFGSSVCEEAAQTLFESLENIEQKIPTHRVDRPGKKRNRQPGSLWTWEDDDSDEEWKLEPYVETDEPFWLMPEEENQPTAVSFTCNILQPIMADKSKKNDSASTSGGVHALSLEYLVELEKNPWRYSNILDVPVPDGGEATTEEGQKRHDESSALLRKDNPQLKTIQVLPRVKLRDAIGERRYKEWKIANDYRDEDDDYDPTPVTAEQSDTNDGFDLSTLLLNIPELPLAEENSMPSSGGSAGYSGKNDAEDCEKVRHCLELAFGGSGSQEEISFVENGRDMIAEAELALRNHSAQRYLFSVLISSVQRRKAQRSTQQEDLKNRAMATQQSVSRLEPAAFECIVRLCYAVLEACTEEQNYESAYRLLTSTGGFCTAVAATNFNPGGGDTGTQPTPEHKTIYMTERISIHPIFVDLRLWARVLLLHQEDQQNNERKDDANNAEPNEEEETERDASSEAENEDNADNDAYDSSVTTIYEMVGYNVPAEEVSRFASRISEEKGWFATEKGQALLVLARRLTAKRDNETGHDAEKKTGGAAAADEFAYARQNSNRDSSAASNTKDNVGGGIALNTDDVLESEEIAWSMPSRCLVSFERQVGARAFLGNMLGSTGSEIPMVGSGSTHGVTHHKRIGSGSTHGVTHHKRSSNNKKRILDANDGDYVGRVAITAMASFGGSAVVTGGIDGSIFLAHTIDPSARVVNGVQLQWGGKGEVDRDSCSGSVSCIAASKGSGCRFGGGGADKANSKSVGDHGCSPDEEDITSSMEGCQVIAGTTGGGLRVWSLKDVYYASRMLHRRENGPSAAASSSLNRSHHGSGATSGLLGSGGTAEEGVLQDALAGAEVGGHRGGVTCIDLPPRMYRPDSLVSGGEDGLIKLWSLKSCLSEGAKDGGGGAARGNNSVQSRFFQGRQITPIGAAADFDASEAQGVLTGHEGKIVCINTAWHGDKLLSGGADKTVRLWDLSGNGGGRPLMTLRGHRGLVTQTHFWGPNAIVSSSTDRCIHLWDTRVGSSPLFALRYHLAPVSDLLLGNRSEPLMVSAGADCSLATWDFRVLSSGGAKAASSPPEDSDAKESKTLMQTSLRTLRSPMATMDHIGPSSKSPYVTNYGSAKLARSIGRDDFSFFSIGDGGVVNEWEATSGRKIGTSFDTGHRNAISGFSTFSSSEGLRSARMDKCSSQGGVTTVGGTISCSWDGTVRLRSFSRKPAR